MSASRVKTYQFASLHFLERGAPLFRIILHRPEAQQVRMVILCVRLDEDLPSLVLAKASRAPSWVPCHTF
jgi:hypothetical protein